MSKVSGEASLLDKAGKPATDELINQARAGSEQAFRSLVQQYNQRLFRIARGMTDTDQDAEEIVQETYLKVFCNLDEYRGDSRFSTWISRIAINEALARNRRKTVDTTQYDDQSEVALDDDRLVRFPGTPWTDPAEMTAESQTRQLLEQSISELDANLRVIVVLHESEQMSIKAIAADLGLKPVSVRTRLFRARRQLKKKLQRRLQGGFERLYPFGGARCVNMANKVIEGLRSRNRIKRP